MSTHASAAELRKMSIEELRKETDRRRTDVAKARLGIGMRSLKDTAQFRRDKRELARMLTVLTQLEAAHKPELKPQRKPSRVSAPARPRARKAGRSSASA